DAERAAGELADRIVEQRKAAAPRPLARAAQPVVADQVLRQTEDQREYVLDDRARAVFAAVRDRDTAGLRGGRIDVVGAGRGQYDQAEVFRPRYRVCRQARLVDDRDLAALEPGRDLVFARVRKVRDV